MFVPVVSECFVFFAMSLSNRVCDVEEEEKALATIPDARQTVERR